VAAGSAGAGAAVVTVVLGGTVVAGAGAVVLGAVVAGANVVVGWLLVRTVALG
jgi:hypothetical protein